MQTIYAAYVFMALRQMAESHKGIIVLVSISASDAYPSNRVKQTLSRLKLDSVTVNN